MKDEFFFAPDWSPLLQDDPAQNAPMGQNPTHNETTPAPNWGPLIREVLNERALMAKNALGYASQYVNADEAAEARRISQDTGITYGEALRNPEEARRLERRQAFGQFVDAHPDQADWILQNAEIAHDDIAAIGAIVSSAKEMLPFISSETGKQMIATLAGPLLPGGAVLGRPVMQGAVGDFLGSSIHGLGETVDVGVRSLARSFDLPDEFDLSSYPDDDGLLGDARAIGRNVWNAVRKMERTGNNPLLHVGQGLKDVGDFIGPKDQNLLINQVARGVGQGIPMIALYRFTGSALPALIAFGQGADQMAEDAKREGVYGAPEGDIGTIGGGALTAITNGFTLPAYTAPLEKITGTLTRLFARGLLGGAAEGLQETVEQIGQNTLANQLYAPARELWEGVSRSALVGFLTGFVLGGGNGLVQTTPERAASKPEKTGAEDASVDPSSVETPPAEDSSVDPSSVETPPAEDSSVGPSSVETSHAEDSQLENQQEELPTAKELEVEATILDNNARALEADEAQRRLHELMDDAFSSRLMQRDAAALAQLVNLGENSRTVFMPAIELIKLATGKRRGPMLFAELGLSQREIISAYHQDGDVAINIGALVTSKLAQAIRATITPHIRMSPQDMTKAEAVQWRETGRDAYRREAQSALAENERADKAASEAAKAAAMQELVAGLPQGTKITVENLVDIRKMPDGKTVWLETGTEARGLAHVHMRHAMDFAKKGILSKEIPTVIMNALEHGKIIGTNGTGPVYRITHKGGELNIIIGVGSNGFVIRANPTNEWKPLP